MEFDVIIRNGQIVDGSGEPAFPADLGIVGDRVAAVDRLGDAVVGEEIDASGRVVAPGFIDVHIHSEVAIAQPGHPRRFTSTLQGVTTHLTAPDGFGWAPLAPEPARELWETTSFSTGEVDFEVGWPTPEAYLARFAGNTPVNVVPQVPHCAVRLEAMGWADRPATDDELARMKQTTRAWMEAGATCLNLGLDYQPSAFADTRELIELSRVAAEYDGIYAAHVRYNEIGLEAAWRETFEIGRQANIPVHISHEHVTDETIPLLEEAAQICDLTFESYLYPAGSTHLALLLPVWAQAGGVPGLRRRLPDPEFRRMVREVLQETIAERIDVAGGDIVFASTQTGRFVGERFADAAAREGKTYGEFALQVLEEEDPYALMVFHHGGSAAELEQKVVRTVQHPAMMLASDGIYHGQTCHPRASGCFARALRLCVRDLGVVSLEEMVRKMSGFPAERFRIKDRGLLRPGYGADVVIFDPETVAERSTWTDTWAEPVGIDRVLVNGQTVVQNGVPTGALPGRVLT